MVTLELVLRLKQLCVFPTLKETRPVWTGFKIAVRNKLLMHYKKAKVLYDQSKEKKGLMLNWYESKLIFQ
jgi:hypothetical protein